RMLCALCASGVVVGWCSHPPTYRTWHLTEPERPASYRQTMEANNEMASSMTTSKGFP
ncbi:hypothetical protein DPEC_G00369540, partial [Dallia pectoralis]